MRFAAASSLALALLAAGCGSSKPFTATADGTTFSIPGGWRKLNDKELADANSGFVGGMTRSAPGATGSITGAWCPTNLVGTAKDAAVMAISVGMPPGSVADEAFIKNLKQGAAAGALGVGATAKDITYLGTPSLRIDLPQIPIDGKPGKVASIWSLKDGKIKIVMYIALVSEFDKYLADYEKIVASAK
jgi:hypothetical protein